MFKFMKLVVLLVISHMAVWAADPVLEAHKKLPRTLVLAKPEDAVNWTNFTKEYNSTMTAFKSLHDEMKKDLVDRRAAFIDKATKKVSDFMAKYLDDADKSKKTQDELKTMPAAPLNRLYKSLPGKFARWEASANTVLEALGVKKPGKGKEKEDEDAGDDAEHFDLFG